MGPLARHGFCYEGCGNGGHVASQQQHSSAAASPAASSADEEQLFLEQWPARTGAPARRGKLRAVLFDFDATLTAREELQVWRLFPERGGFGNGIDINWLRDKGFGGEQRIQSLGSMLASLQEQGAELHVVSYADRELIVRALAILGALHFFCDRIVGWQELGVGTWSKGAYIRELMESRSWGRDEVLFVDDQEKNIHGAKGLCLTHKVRGCGLSVGEMEEIVGQASTRSDAASSLAMLKRTHAEAGDFAFPQRQRQKMGGEQQDLAMASDARRFV